MTPEGETATHPRFAELPASHQDRTKASRAENLDRHTIADARAGGDTFAGGRAPEASVTGFSDGGGNRRAIDEGLE